MNYASESKDCQNCKRSFVIELGDFSFYQKMQVPPPTWCPECRLTRRFSFVNTWSLFWRKCNKCGERTMSEYPQEQKLTVYCPKCWWGARGMGQDTQLITIPQVRFWNS